MSESQKALLVLFNWICIAYTALATISPCSENRTELCVQNLATFITLDSPRFAIEAELERLCRAAEDGQRCSSDFLKSSTCVSPTDQLSISLQIGRSQSVSKLLCSSGGYVTDPVFRQLYLKHASCIEDQQRQIKECYASSNVVEDPEKEIVRNSSKSADQKHMTFCCPLVRYIECSENAIGTSCGSESKNVVLRVLKAAAGKQLEDFCSNVDSNFPNSPIGCTNTGAAQQTVLRSFRFAVVYLIIVLCIS